MELQELGKRAKAAEIIMRNLGMKEKEGCIRGGTTPASTSALL